MATFTLKSQSYDGRYLQLDCTQSIDIATNTSTISWTLTSTGGNVNYYAVGPTTVKINGTTVYYKDLMGWATYEFPAAKGSVSGTTQVAHDTQGEASIAVSIQTSIYTGVLQTKSGNWTLDTIPRQANITSAPSFTDEQNPTISYSNPAGNAVTSLQACITNSTGGVQYAKYRDISKTGTSYQFTLTDAERTTLRNATPNSNTLTVRFYIKTTIGGVDYYSSAEKTMSIVNANPTISASAVDTNSATTALTGDNTKFIRYYSDVKVSVTATAKKSATISSTSGAGTFNDVETNSWTVGAIDSRGNSTTQTVSGTLIPYVRLTCNLGNEMPDTSGNMTVRCSGNYYNGSFGAVANTLTVQYRYKTQGGSYGSWTNMTVTKSGNTYSATASLSGLSYQETYIFQTRATDKLATASTDENAVKSKPIFHWGENDFVFEVPVSFAAGCIGCAEPEVADGADGDFNITGNLRLKGSGNYGNTLYFGDGSYCYLTETTDDDLTIKSSDLNLNVSKLYYNQRSIEYGQWTPTLGSSGAVSSYSVRQGWYQKLGSVVTIGWQIKASINSGYDSTSISISGVPFTPSYDASGGGMCSGAYVSGGFNFECWAINSSGNITARVQACNNTSSANLSTSASGLFYRSGSGEITLGGTICYLTSN